MKKSLTLAIVLALCAVCAGTSFSQVSATQTVNLAVNSIQRIAVAGGSVTLTITDGTAGTDALQAVSDASTSYSITHNSTSPLRITANLDAALAAGYQLQVNLASNKGTSSGTVDISSATSSSAVAVVTAIGAGADANRSITYTFSANASAGVLSPTLKTVTLTLTN